MATIVFNGGSDKTRLRIVPESPPETVRAHRDLELMRRELAHFQHVFANTPQTKEAVHEKCLEIGTLIKRYCNILETCARALAKDIESMPEEKRRYYKPVLTFLSRASEVHTILPFDRYVQHYRNILSMGPQALQRHQHLPFLSYLRGFIEERIAESIRTCEAYCALLSGSLGVHMRFFSLNDMLFRIAITQQEVSISYRANQVYKDDEATRRLRDQHKNGVNLDLDPVGEIFSISPLAYFLLLQIISNAFKASFGAYWAQKTDIFIGREYRDMPQLPEPKIGISLVRTDVAHSKIVIADNGIGVPSGMLKRLIDAEAETKLGGFAQIQPSNGSSTMLFPFLADLLGVEMSLSSDGVGRGFIAELVFPMDINMRSAITQ